MKGFAVFVCLLIAVLDSLSLVAQRPVSLFQPLTWEQASLIAAREDKLVLVEVGTPEQFPEQKILADAELLHYLQRNVIAIRINPASFQGQKFLSHLLMHEPPMYAFFMPYGDVLEKVTPEAVGQNPSVLRESFEKARELATTKKRNSRSVRFEPLALETSLKQAEKSGKPVAVYFLAEQDQPSLLLEKNVLNLNEVADLYNQEFVNIRTGVGNELAEKYGINATPRIVFLNAQGKVIYLSEVLRNQEQVLAAARMALKRAKGLEFQEWTEERALQEAKMKNKAVFICYYKAGHVNKELWRTTFADPDVVDFFDRHFINIAVASKQNCIVFLDSEGRELHRVEGEWTGEELLREGQAALQGRGLSALSNRYARGERQMEFLEHYMQVLSRGGKSGVAAEVAGVYFQNMPSDCLLQAKYWEIFERYVWDVNSDLFQYLLTHREELYALYGQEMVQRKEKAVWLAGANAFVRENSWDESDFKAYVKRLKKENATDRRSLIREARMHIAEKLGDWKTFIALGEERWYGEKLADVELYHWGLLIQENCRDEDLRYKMAQWLLKRVFEIERQERTSGQVKITSYRGFMEKLANDLLKK